MNLDRLRTLCSPAAVYLAVSLLAYAMLLLQNWGNTTKYCVGNFSCEVTSTMMVFIGKFLYIAFWTFILNALCKAGYKEVSWFLVLFPIILFFIGIGLFMLSSA